MAVTGVNHAHPPVTTPKPATTTKPAEDKPTTAAAQAAEGAAAVDKPAAAPAADTHAPGETHAAGEAHAAGEPAGAHGGGGHAEAVVIPPARNDSRFVAGTTGPGEAEGKAPTVTIPDGPGFAGEKGRKQNAGDKEQNNYSVTDANYNNELGLLAKDPDTGKPLTYVQHIQTYSAAGYIETFSPDTYKKLAANQNAGKGTILGASAYIMGLVKTPDPALAGVDISKVPMKVPGTSIDAKAKVLDAQDGTGQDWARMHHAQTSWSALKGLLAIGVDEQAALRFSGDDAISGSGRLNGVNNQDGTSGFNAGELEIYKEAAAYQQRTGLPVILQMMQGHNHNSGQGAGSLTDPAINKQIGLAANDRSATAERANAIAAGLLDGRVRNEQKADNGGADHGPKAPNPDVTMAEATAAGGGPVGTVDIVDPAAALDEIVAAGFEDGSAGESSTRLALLMSQMLGRSLIEKMELSAEQQGRLGIMAKALAASTDPVLQGVGLAIQGALDMIAANGGAMTPEARELLIGALVTMGLATGTLDAAFAKQVDPALLAKLGIDAAKLPEEGMVDVKVSGTEAAIKAITDAEAAAAGIEATPPPADGSAPTADAAAGAAAIAAANPASAALAGLKALTPKAEGEAAADAAAAPAAGGDAAPATGGAAEPAAGAAGDAAPAAAGVAPAEASPVAAADAAAHAVAHPGAPGSAEPEGASATLAPPAAGTSTAAA